MTSILLDIRHAVRVLARSAGVSLMAVFTLALAIGATTAIFSVVYGVLLRPLPYPGADRLVKISEVTTRGTLARVADPNFDDLRDRNHTFGAMAKYSSGGIETVQTSEPTRASVSSVTKDFFTVLGVTPVRGRTFSGDDARMDATPAAVVSHRYWTEHLGAATNFSALSLRLENRIFAVIGVMPAGFQFPAGVDIWTPAELGRESPSRTSHNFSAVGRLKEGVSVAQARADLSGIAKRIISEATEKNDYLMADATAVALQESMTGRVGSTLYILLGAVFFLLLVACANVTNLLLSQASVRGREIAIRQALGAGRLRLTRQFLVESVLLVAASSVVGLLVASLGVRALISLAPANLPRLDEVSLSWPVLWCSAGLSWSVAIGLGLVTALRTTGRDPREGLVAGGRGQVGASNQRVGRTIVAAQVAITAILLVGAALLGRSLLRVLSVDPGFRVDRIVAMDLNLPYSEAPEAKERLSPFLSDVIARLGTVPGVDEVAAASAVPLDGGLPDGMFLVLKPQENPKTFAEVSPLFRQPDRTGNADFCAASPGYFHVLGIPLLKGRVFDDRDSPTAPHAAVISDSLAKSRWPNEDPIGRTLEFGNMDGDLRVLTIVGVVGDTHEYGLELPPQPTVYVNLLQRPRFTTTVVIRSRADMDGVITAARQVLRTVAPTVPPRFRTLEDIYSTSLGARHFNFTLVVVFAVTALILAVAGVYSVMSYTVVRRRREIGVRMALGAAPDRVVRSILGQGLLTTAGGLIVGVLGAFALSRTLESLLFQTTPTDPAVFAFVAAVLAGVAGVASYVPARRAARVNPIEALREG